MQELQVQRVMQAPMEPEQPAVHQETLEPTEILEPQAMQAPAQQMETLAALQTAQTQPIQQSLRSHLHLSQ
jgi:hypothetical protein